MGFRFSKRIKIMKGLNLNVSRGGLGLSVGVPGARVSFGPRGTRSTIGIPGTGISYSQSHNSNRTHQQKQNVSTVKSFRTRIEIDEETATETIRVFDEGNNEIFDDRVKRRIKSLPEFKNSIKHARENAWQLAQDKNDALFSINEKCVELIDASEFYDALQKNSPDKYIREIFDVEKPTRNSIKSVLEKKAKQQIHTWKFWNLGKLRRAYVHDHIDSEYELACNLWENEREIFERDEDEYALKQNKIFADEYENRKRDLYSAINGDAGYIDGMMDSIFSKLELPQAFQVSWKIENNEIYLDIDLPEIEDFPTKKPVINSKGEFSFKKKTIKEMNEDYSHCAIGMGFFFSSLVFNISPKIDRVIVTGYTQRLSKKTGRIEDTYVYEVNFSRSMFLKINPASANPLDALKNFTHQIKVKSNGELGEIYPSI